MLNQKIFNSGYKIYGILESILFYALVVRCNDTELPNYDMFFGYLENLLDIHAYNYDISVMYHSSRKEPGVLYAKGEFCHKLYIPYTKYLELLDKSIKLLHEHVDKKLQEYIDNSEDDSTIFPDEFYEYKKKMELLDYFINDLEKDSEKYLIKDPVALMNFCDDLFDPVLKKKILAIQRSIGELRYSSECSTISLLIALGALKQKSYVFMTVFNYIVDELDLDILEFKELVLDHIPEYF